MILSFINNFLFLKAPKTASTSVEEALSWSCDPYTDIFSGQQATGRVASLPFQRRLSSFCGHIQPHDIITSGVLTQDEFDRIPKIAVVRNPWDLNVSRWWMHVMKVETNSSKSYQGLRLKEIEKRYKEDFNQWVLDYFNHYTPRNDEQVYYLDSRGSSFLSHVIRYEHLQQSFYNICRCLGLTRSLEKELPRAHTDYRIIPTHYSEMYTPETRELVEFNYEDILREFNYAF